jgi:cold shock CspA family protein
VGETYLLHCIEIADGSRDIAVGQRVEFATTVRFGRAEAARVVKL